MVEEGSVSGKPNFVVNRNVKVKENVGVEERIDDVKDKKWDQHDGEAEMEEDKRGDVGNIEAQDMNVDKKEVNKSKEVEDKVDGQKVEKEGKKGGKEENMADEEKQEGSRGGEEETKKKETHEEKQEALGEGREGETMIQKMGDDSEETTKKETEEQKKEVSGGTEVEIWREKVEENSQKETEGKVEEEVDGVKDYEEKLEDPKEEKGLNKRPRIESTVAKMDKTEKMKSEEKVEDESKIMIEKRTKKPKSLIEKEGKEQRTPTHSSTNRPVRERKSVKRLVASIYMEKDAVREFQIEKGRGTALKDIPKVASKLSRKKNDDTFKSLHTILFARRGKASLFKNNISRFSGFLWHDDEEKQMIKLKEKLDKYMKEKLVEFCDVLDIPIPSANHIRKEEIIVKLIEFLVEPRATTSEMLAEKDQSSKGKKRKRTTKSASGSTTPLKVSSKQSWRKVEGTSEKSGETNITPFESENETREEKAHFEEEDVNSVSERSEDERAESEDKGKQKPTKAKSCGKEQPAQKSINSSHPAKNTRAKLPAIWGKNNDDKGSRKPSSKKKDESMENSSSKKTTESIKKCSSKNKESIEESSQKELASKENISENCGEKVLEEKDEPKEAILSPSKEELRTAICEILKEADISTATFIDILNLLTKRFDTDLTPTKLQIKLMVMDELKKLADKNESLQKPCTEAVNTD